MLKYFYFLRCRMNPESLFCIPCNNLIVFRGIKIKFANNEKGGPENLLTAYPMDTVLDNRMHVRPDWFYSFSCQQLACLLHSGRRDTESVFLLQTTCGATSLSLHDLYCTLRYFSTE